MPFNTGSQPWDQALGSLSAGLFPDPSKINEGYYYGAKARETQTQAEKNISQSRAQPQIMGALQGQPIHPSYYTAPSGMTMLADPNTPAAAGPAAGPPSLSATVAPGPTAAPPPGPPPNPNTPVPQTMSPATVANVVADRVMNMPDNGPVRPDSFTPAGGGIKGAPPAAPDGSPAPLAFNLAQFHQMQMQGGVPGDQAAIQDRAVIGNWVKNGQMDQVTADKLLASFGEAAPRTTTIAGETSRAVTAATQAGETARTRLTTASQERVAGMPSMFVADDPTNPNVGHWTTIGKNAAGGNVAGFNPATAPTVAQQQGAVGNYLDPKTGRVVPQTAGQAITAGMSPAPSSTDQGNAQEIAAIQAETDLVKQQALIDRFVNVRAGTSMPATPSDDEAFKNQQLQQAAVESLNPIPTGGQIRQGGTNLKPAALTAEGDSVLSHLADQYFRRNPAGGRVNAITSAYQQLVRQGYFNPNPDRSEAPLSTAAQINKLVPDPKVKGAFIAAPHFRVDLLDPKTHKPLAPGQVPTVNIDQGSLGQTVAPDASQPALTQPAPTVPAPTVAAPAQTAPAQAAQAAPVPSPPVSAIFNPRATSRGQAPSTFGVPPAPEITTGRRGRSSRPGRGEAAAPQAQAQGGMPQGALGPAPGVPDGTPGTTTTGQRGIVRGGWVFPAS